MWNTEHILNNNYELGICVICDKNKKLVSNRFYVTFFDLMIAGSSSCGASNYNTENVFYKTMYLNWYYTCIYRTKVFVYMKTSAYLSELFILYCISHMRIFEKQFRQLSNIRWRSFQSPDCSTCTILCEYWRGRSVTYSCTSSANSLIDSMSNLTLKHDSANVKRVYSNML